MEDTPDKLRRNVVVFSALIVAIAFLKPSLKSQSALLGIADLSEVDQTRVWICVLAALVYIFLRFYFDEPEAIARKSFANQVWHKRIAYVQKLISREMTALLRRGQPPKILIDHKAFFDDFLQCEGFQYRSKMTASARLTPNIDGRTGTTGFSLSAFQKGKALYQQHGGPSCGYSVPLILHCILQVVAIIRVATFSKVSIDTLVPYLLSAAAATICANKIVFYATGT